VAPFLFGATMDLKQYFKKVREIEASIKEPYVLVSSLETPDGGKAGVISEVTRAVAATIIAEGRAALTTEEEAIRYAEQQSAARQAAEKALLAKRVQVAIIAEPSQQNESLGNTKSSVPKK
jgi:hypothetical protein